jgi:endonuclease YncB( thermonuclease family)
MSSREILGWLVVAGMVVAFVLGNSPRGETISGPVRVVDGDSLHVGDTEVRLFGVDAFEGRQVCVRDGNSWRCGEAAANELRKLTTGRAITCSKRDTDSYGRTVAVCRDGTVDLAAELARAGLALAYRQFSDDYADEESEAKAARRGAWAGDFTPPWDARRAGDTQPRQPQSGNGVGDGDGDALSGCRGTGIKGNISKPSGELIYHVRGSSSYDETRIDEADGERWFCTEDDARRAGWRARR